jgi:GNAT superfamily N-acetyltransferase
MESGKAKYYGFPVATHGSAVIGIERMADNWDELTALHRQHYDETETLYAAAPFDPDREGLLAAEDAGRYVVFTTRVAGKLVGYLQYHLFRSLHSRHTLVSKEDAFYLLPEVRGNWLAPRMLTYAEDILVKLGCKYTGMSSKGPVGGPDLGPFLERRGYRPVSVFYSKRLEE